VAGAHPVTLEGAHWCGGGLALVLPPSVLGFYLLLAMGPSGPVGQLTQALGLGRCLSPLGVW
jgi:molybdate transport system permease protein